MERLLQGLCKICGESTFYIIKTNTNVFYMLYIGSFPGLNEGGWGESIEKILLLSYSLLLNKSDCNQLEPMREVFSPPLYRGFELYLLL